MKKIPIIIWGVVLIAIIALSFVNTKITNSITGNPVFNLGQEFPGIGIVLIVLFGILGMFFIMRLK